MKKIVALASVLLATAAMLPAQQMSLKPTLRADVPFEFAAGGATLPAGVYRLAFDSFFGTVIVSNLTGKAGAMFIVNQADLPAGGGRAQLIFNQTEGHMTLTAVHYPTTYVETARRWKVAPSQVNAVALSASAK